MTPSEDVCVWLLWWVLLLCKTKETYMTKETYYLCTILCSVKSAAARQYASTNASGAIVESARGLPSASTTASVTDARCSDSQWLVLMCVISVYWDALALGVYSYAPCADCLPECNVCV